MSKADLCREIIKLVGKDKYGPNIWYKSNFELEQILASERFIHRKDLKQ